LEYDAVRDSSQTGSTDRRHWLAARRAKIDASLRAVYGSDEKQPVPERLLQLVSDIGQPDRAVGFS
jgi:hypothetical protein